MSKRYTQIDPILEKICGKTSVWLLARNRIRHVIGSKQKILAMVIEPQVLMWSLPWLSDVEGTEPVVLASSDLVYFLPLQA